MSKAKRGDIVSLDYTLHTVDGALVDTSAGRPPIRFTLGSGEVIPGLDQAVLGMELGEHKTVLVPPALAHGPRRPERVLRFKRDVAFLAAAVVVEPGRTELFTTAKSADSTVIEDYNHPLAGKDLAFEITLVSIDGTAD